MPLSHDAIATVDMNENTTTQALEVVKNMPTDFMLSRQILSCLLMRFILRDMCYVRKIRKKYIIIGTTKLFFATQHGRIFQFGIYLTAIPPSFSKNIISVSSEGCHFYLIQQVDLPTQIPENQDAKTKYTCIVITTKIQKKKHIHRHTKKSSIKGKITGSNSAGYSSTFRFSSCITNTLMVL